MIRMALCIFLVASIGWGDTINSSAKNPAMSVNGIQRDSSQIINQTCPYWAGDLNAAPGDAGTTNCLNGAGLGNAPTGDWYFVHTDYHSWTNSYAIQTVVGMTGAATNLEYVRNKGNGVWGAWALIGGAHAAQLFLGITPGVNAGVVSTNPNHNGGATIPIGFSMQ